MCLRVPTARPRSTRRGRGAPQQATCTNGLGASRAVAGQAVGLHQNTTSGRGGEGALVERCSHRSTETRRDADEEGGVAPGGAGAGASRHREAAGRRARAREAPPERRAHSSPLRLRGDCARRAGLTRAGEDLRRAPEPRQHAPLFPAAPASRLGPLARRRAEAPESCTVAPTAQVSSSCGRRGAAAVLRVSGLSRAAEGRRRMPERRPDGVLGHHLCEALQGLPEAPPGSSQKARTAV